MRQDFEMTDEDLSALLESMKPVPMIALQCGTPRSVQENANEAWARLGTKMGFNSATVRPNGRGNKFFSAEPTCKGIEIDAGGFSGCQASNGDCPSCGK